MRTLPTWRVNLQVTGPITVPNRMQMQQLKGNDRDSPFYSDITINDSPSGFRAVVTARALDEQLAYQAAVFFFGRMLDVLTLETLRPLHLGYAGETRRIEEYMVRRIVHREEIETAFTEMRRLDQDYPTFLRSLGWFRKGLYTDDPFDSFLALWNSVEGTAARYYKMVSGIDLDRAKKGIKNQIWACFQKVWGENKQWKIIPGNADWINSNYDVRIGIAHGVKDVTIDNIQDVVEQLPILKKVAYEFLVDWREKQLSGTPPPIAPERVWARAEPDTA